MHIPVKRDRGRSMTEHFGKRLDFKADFNSARGKRMPERVKMHAFKAAFTRVFFHSVLQGSRLHKFFRSCQNVSS